MGDGVLRYCEKCKRIFYDNKKLCEGCSEKLRTVADDDLVSMLNVGSFEKERIKIVLEDSSIDAVYEKNRRKYDISIRYSDYDKAADILMKIDALPYNYKKMEVNSLAESHPEEEPDESDGDVKDSSQNKSEQNIENTEKAEEIKEEKNKAINESKDRKTDNSKDNEIKKETISTEDNDKTVYELFGFQNLSKGKRMLTGAILWILFAVVLFLIIAGVDMGVEFIKGLFV